MNSDVYFFLQSPIIIGNDHDIVFRVDNFVCPISFFVVNSTNNSLVTNTSTVTISEGNYNALSLKTELTSLLSGYTVTYDSTTNKFTFSRATPFSFSATSTCFKLLGFDAGVTHTATFDGTSYKLTSDNVVNLSGTSLIYIDIPNITTRNIAAKNNGSFTTIVKSVVQDVPYGSILSYVNNTNAAVVIREKYLSYFRIRLLDDDYNLLDLQGQDFTLTIELYYFYNGQAPGYVGNLTDVAREQEELKKSLGKLQ